MELKDLVEQFNTVNTELKNLRQKHEDELQAANDGNAEAKTAVEELKTQLEEMSTKHEQSLNDLVAEMKRPGGGQGEEVKTLGGAFVTEAKEAIDGGTLLGKSIKIESKDITGTTGSGGALVRPDRDRIPLHWWHASDANCRPDPVYSDQLQRG